MRDRHRAEISQTMKLFEAIVAATAAEASLLGACLGLASVGGAWNGWLDVLAHLAPLWFVLSLVGGLLALPVIDPGPAKMVVLVLAAVGMISSGGLIAPELGRAFAPTAGQGRGGGAPLKVLTFNTWSKNIDPRGSAEAVIASGADVVAIQETAGLGDLDRRRLRGAYPYWETCRPACDLILMSKTPWTATGSRQGQVPRGYFTVAWATTTAPDGRPFTLATTHYAWPFPPKRQAAQRAALAETIAGLDKTDLVVTGDFNLTPWSAALRAQDHTLAPLRRLTRAVFSWPANLALFYRPAPFPFLPIDHIYAGPAWRTVAIRRLPRLGSDHYPVMVELSRAPGAAR